MHTEPSEPSPGMPIPVLRKARLSTRVLAGSFLVAAAMNGLAAAQVAADQTSATDHPQAGSPAPAVDLETEVRAIAEVLRDNLGNAARWKPTTSQINAISATKADADRLRAYVGKVYAELSDSTPAAKAGQTQIIVTGPDLRDLAGGYRKKVGHFRPGVAIYGFKYVEPGKDSGMRYDGLIRVRDTWIFIPKAWRAFTD
jgi:hypothetical protein